MFQRIFLSAIGAGFAVGILMAAIHQFTTVPLIIKAEVYENSADKAAYLMVPQVSMVIKAVANDWDFAKLVHKVHGKEVAAEGAEEAWGPEDGFERIAYTSLATIIISAGFALLLVGAFSLTGRPVDGRQGVLWGIAAFAAFTLAPALGLPPELPGSAAAELVARQGWWLGTAIATALGLAGLVFSSNWVLRGLALVLIVLPHVIGAPHPHEFTSTAPAELSGHFAAASIVVSAIFWSLLGWTSGTLYSKL